MAYTVNKTDGTILATVADGTINTTTDLTLIGKNYAGYGEFFNENLIKLLENFSNSSAPASESSSYIAGVISTEPAFLMNNAADGQEIALVGRVPVLVDGEVNKGDAVFAANGGVASKTASGPLVGIALETNSNSGVKSVECLLKV